MLDMHLLADTSTMPKDDTPAASEYLGSLALEQAEMLQCVWDLCKEYGIAFDYFTDIHWPSYEVKIIAECCRECYELNSNPVVRGVCTYLLGILERAIEQESGIAAYAD